MTNARKYVLAFALCAVSFVAGWFACSSFGANVVEVEKVVTKEVPIEIPVQVKGDTEIVYVEKESPDDSDVQIVNEKPTVSVDFNGEKTEFQTLDNETQKFEKGKLKVEQSSSVNLDVTPIVDREVDRAVDAQKEIDEMAKDKAVKEEHKKGNQKAVNGALGGIGVGLLIGLLL